MTAVETIRKAAALMRRRAEAATGGVWWRDGSAIVAAPSGDYTDPDDEPIAVAAAPVFRPIGRLVRDRSGADLDHIAGFQPRVALAVAAWLEQVAAAWASAHTIPVSDVSTDQEVADALAVARAYLGQAEGGES